MKTLNKATGELLHKSRYDNCLTRPEMARKCHLSQKYYNNLETGKKAPSLRTFIDISINCDIDVNAFINEMKKRCYPPEETVLETITYCFEKEQRTTEDGIQYISFNVLVKNKDVVIRRIPDVFTDERQAQQFVDMCNRLKLDPQHVEDAVDDVLIK